MERRVLEDCVSTSEMSGRQLLPRLLQRASRLATANSKQPISQCPAPCNFVTMGSSLYRNGVATSASWSESRSLCSHSLVTDTANVLGPIARLRNGVNLANREVGFTAVGVTYVRLLNLGL